MNSTTMVESEHPKRTTRTGEVRENANTGECLGNGREVRQGACQRNRAVERLRLEDWLPRNAVVQLSLPLCTCVCLLQVRQQAKLDILRAAHPVRSQ